MMGENNENATFELEWIRREAERRRGEGLARGNYKAKTDVEAASGLSVNVEFTARPDAGKPRFELIPADALEEVAKVFAYGARKYSDDGWAAGFMWRRYAGSLLRHAYAWLRGEDRDPSSGLHHLAHCACNCLILIAYAKREIGLDDRIKK